MRRLPATDMHHSLSIALFAFDCLLHALLHPPRKAR